MPLNKDQIQQAKPKTREVDVEELKQVGDGKILLGVMPALQLTDIMQNWGDDTANNAGFKQDDAISFLAHSIIDPDTLKPMYTIEELTEVARNLLSWDTIQNLYQQAADLHGLTSNALEDQEKNSQTPPGDSSGGVSPGSEDTPTPTTSLPS